MCIYSNLTERDSALYWVFTSQTQLIIIVLEPISKTINSFWEMPVVSALVLAFADFLLGLFFIDSSRCFSTASAQILCDRSDPAKGEKATSDPVAKPSRYVSEADVNIMWNWTLCAQTCAYHHNAANSHAPRELGITWHTHSWAGGHTHCSVLKHSISTSIL